MTLELHHKIYTTIGAIAITLLSWIAIESALTMHAARALAVSAADSAALVNAALRGKHKNGDDGYLALTQHLLQNSDGAANAVKQTMQDANRIAKAQEKPTVALTTLSIDAMSKIGESAGQLSGMISDVRQTSLPAINRGIAALGGVATSLDGLVTDLRPTAQALTGVANESGNTVRSLNLAINHADALISSPELEQVSANLNSMSQNLSLASGHVNGATASAEMALGYVRDDLSPKKLPFWQSILSEALSQAIGIPLKWLPSRTAVVSSVPITVK